MDYLRGAGIAADRLTAVGYGEANPIASNETEEGRAANRRIEFSLLADDDVDGGGTEAQDAAPDATTVLVCGGGVHNDDLMARLRITLAGMQVETTATAGLDPDWVEAAAFAWLAMRSAHDQPGNLPSVTGATGAAVLGAIFPGAG